MPDGPSNIPSANTLLGPPEQPEPRPSSGIDVNGWDARARYKTTNKEAREDDIRLGLQVEMVVFGFIMDAQQYKLVVFMTRKRCAFAANRTYIQHEQDIQVELLTWPRLAYRALLPSKDPISKRVDCWDERMHLAFPASRFSLPSRTRSSLLVEAIGNSCGGGLVDGWRIWWPAIVPEPLSPDLWYAPAISFIFVKTMAEVSSEIYNKMRHLSCATRAGKTHESAGFAMVGGIIRPRPVYHPSYVSVWPVQLSSGGECLHQALTLFMLPSACLDFEDEHSCSSSAVRAKKPALPKATSLVATITRCPTAQAKKSASLKATNKTTVRTFAGVHEAECEREGKQVMGWW
ncbi:hypothetical protein BC834DRAFT_845588 [Gloeopeniophorella convolvens]|nr:hypothetical protein BC834DRAFT_845588 [Gloeopeniophorella convolvens]